MLHDIDKALLWTMLRGTVILVFSTTVTLAIAHMSNTSEVLRFFNVSMNNNDLRYSNNVFEDGKLLVPNLISKYQYPIHLHTITTPDGYILEIHRIPHGRYKNNNYNLNKPVIFLMHGLFCSSGVWVLMGPGHGLAYILAEEGYDIWMGNARGNTYSRRHTKLNPDRIFNKEYWKFSWDEIGNIDLPTMIDYILQVTNRPKLHYIGHSQGTTTFFVMASLRPEYYNLKIISMHALAPVVYMGHNSNKLLTFIAPFAQNIKIIESMLGLGEFLPNNAILTWAGQKVCQDNVVFQPACTNIMFLIGGWNEAEFNKTMLPTIVGHLPAGSAVRQVVHYAQGIHSKQIRRFDHGNSWANRKVYGSSNPPNYDLSRITAPVFLYYSENDPMVHVYDVDRLYGELGNPKGKYRVPLTAFTHWDFVFAIHSRELVFNTILDSIKTILYYISFEDRNLSTLIDWGQENDT